MTSQWCAAASKRIPFFPPPRSSYDFDGAPLKSVVVGVGHPIQSLSDVRRTEARSAGIDRPEGVARAFHVRLNKVEPSKSVLARNLFASDSDRSALFDKVECCRP